MLHAIGDSHAAFTPFPSNAYAGATAHNLVSDSSATRARRCVFEVLDGEIPTDTTLLLVFGEVDCRAHIRDEAMARATIERYGRFIGEVRDRGYEVIVHSVIGATHWVDSIGQVTLPDIHLRGEIVLMFNRLLAEWCADNGVRFFAIDSADKHGIVRRELTTDLVHLSHAAHLYAELTGGN